MTNKSLTSLTLLPLLQITFMVKPSSLFALWERNKSTARQPPMHTTLLCKEAHVKTTLYFREIH